MLDEPLLSLDEAARLLGYKASGLRKIVARTKRGATTHTIQFFQIGRGPIKFRREWIEAFIESKTVNAKPAARSPVQKRAEKPKPVLGFDPALFKSNRPWAKAER